MKTILINASPKKYLSASQYFIDIERLFVSGYIKKEKLRKPSDGKWILTNMEDGDTVVFSLPLYVDSVPSHVLCFLKDMAQLCKESAIKINVYVISNNGFIEGSQNRAVMKVFENFCERSGMKWRGGIGIGGGVMLSVLRIVLLVFVGILLLSVLISGICYGNWFPIDAFITFAYQFGIILFLNLGVIFCTIKMGCSINKQRYFGEKYTRILLPSFVFIIVTDAFFLIISVMKGGVFRGLFAKKTL